MTKALEKKPVGSMEKKSAASASLDLALARSAHTSRKTSVETVDVPRVCALHDQTYIASFRRTAPGWRLVETKRTRNGDAPPARIDAVEIEPMDADSPKEVCPWCNTPSRMFHGFDLSSIQCSKCNMFMCLGRTEGDFFQCRKSCGAKSSLKNAEWINSEGTIRKDANARPVGVRGEATPRKESLRLSSGASITKGGK